jgi:hypothetical protein
MQCIPVLIELSLTRWRCRNDNCTMTTFVERLPTLALPFAQTSRQGEIVRLLGQWAGGRVSERLLRGLGMRARHCTALRPLKRHAMGTKIAGPLRIAGIDDWCWQKGETYRTIIVDLERRTVADVLQIRSAASTQHWLGIPELRSAQGLLFFVR